MGKEVTVAEYIRQQSPQHQKVLKKIRTLIKKTVPGIHEEMKMGVPWYEDKFYLASFKKQVNFGIAYNDLLKKHQDELEGKGKYMRHIKFRDTSEIDEKQLVTLMKAVKKGYVDPHAKK